MSLTYVHSLPTESDVGDYLILDLGGYTFRVSKVAIKDNKSIEQVQSKYILPRDKVASTLEVLLDYVADCVAEFVSEHKIKETLPLSFIFPFPVHQLSLTSGVLVNWAIGFDLSGAVGKDVVQLLQQAFQRKKVSRHSILFSIIICHVWL